MAERPAPPPAKAAGLKVATAVAVALLSSVTTTTSSFWLMVGLAAGAPERDAWRPLIDRALTSQRAADDPVVLRGAGGAGPAAPAAAPVLDDAGRLVLRSDGVDVAAIARRAVETAAPLAWHQRQVQVFADIAPDLALAWADAERVEQILGNLLANATRHTPPRGLVGVVARTEPEVIYREVPDTGVPTSCPTCSSASTAGTAPGAAARVSGCRSSRIWPKLWAARWRPRAPPARAARSASGCPERERCPALAAARPAPAGRWRHQSEKPYRRTL